MLLHDPELTQSARLLSLLQWILFSTMLLLPVWLMLFVFSSQETAPLSQRPLTWLALGGSLISLILLLPIALMIRTRRRLLPAVDQLIQQAPQRPLIMQRTLGFTGLIACRQPGGSGMSATAASSAGPAPAWWLQPLVTNDRLPPLGSQPIQGYWHPASVERLLAWRAPKLGWGRVLSSADIRQQGQQMLLIVLGFGLLIPLVIGVMVGFLVQGIMTPAPELADLSSSQGTAAASQLATIEASISTTQAQVQHQLTALWIALAAAPLLSLVLAWLTWRATTRIAATALDPQQLR
ncbi:hypothetical protein [Rhabdochromatium marinum]|uniref:hypothetical protein n=1 Tax=Rhabdochromatium marinum TaxID=48729 RepID=UPI001907695B|nr:hypothetical protein [Rhabdochromatium marinum]MBK1647765.1 hypothetical protein [Rhabdochromatium marinum]